jgi:hypothetical protein
MNKHQQTRDRLYALRETQPLSAWQSAELARAIRAINGVSRAAADRWSRDEVDYLCDMIADGHPFSACAIALRRGKASCVQQFKKIRLAMGWQAE